jgi:uncharacterized protein YaaQ
MTIVDDNLSNNVSRSLLSKNFRVTRLASTGGFFREGATTLMIGVEDEQVENALTIIRDQIPNSEDPNNHNGTIFVLNVKSFKRV